MNRFAYDPAKSSPTTLFVVRMTLFFVRVIGIVLGLLNIKDGLRIMFVFQNNEGLLDWFFVLIGLLPFLPFVIVSMFWPKVGGISLVMLSLAFMICVIINPQINKNIQDVMHYLLRYFLPMIAFGVAVIFLRHVDPKAESHPFIP